MSVIFYFSVKSRSHPKWVTFQGPVCLDAGWEARWSFTEWEAQVPIGKKYWDPSELRVPAFAGNNRNIRTRPVTPTQAQVRAPPL